MKTLIFFAVLLFLASPVSASTLDGYDRAEVADENYKLAHGDAEIPEAVNDPELFAVMKKYVYGDIVVNAGFNLTENAGEF